MEDILALLVKYGPGLGLAVVVAGLVQALKTAFKKFFTQTFLGMRIIPFVPIVLGMLGGLCLPNQPNIMSKLLVGGALGTLSAVIYKVITRTFASSVMLQQKIDLKQAAVNANVVSAAADITAAETVDPPEGSGDEVK